jgi:uncharacterized repeat protein (TIGR01451 family)
MVRGVGVGFGVQDVWMTGYAHGGCDIARLRLPAVERFVSPGCAGKVSYLGGHQYSTKTPISRNPQTQGARLFLNSLFEAGCVASEGQPIITLTKSAPVAVSSADVTYRITYDNAGPSAALGFTLSDPIPTGSTFVSASSPGTFNKIPPIDPRTVRFRGGPRVARGRALVVASDGVRARRPR